MGPPPAWTSPSSVARVWASAHRTASRRVRRPRPFGSCTTTAVCDRTGTVNWANDRCCTSTASLSAGRRLPASPPPPPPPLGGGTRTTHRAAATHVSTTTHRPETMTLRTARPRTRGERPGELDVGPRSALEDITASRGPPDRSGSPHWRLGGGVTDRSAG